MKLLLMFLLSLHALYSLTLEEAMQRAMQNSPAIDKAQSNINYAKTEVLGAKAAFHPSLDAGLNWQHTDQSTAFSVSQSYYYNLSAKYNLFNGFSDEANLDSKKFQSEAQKLLLMAQESDVKLEVIQAYTNYLKTQKSIKTEEDALNSLERSYQDATIRYELGVIAKNELLLIDVQRLQSQQALIVAKSNLKKAHYTLWRVMGGVLEASEPLEEIPMYPFTIESFEALLTKTYEQRSELHTLYKKREALQSDKVVAEGNFYPRVDVVSNYIIYDEKQYFGTTVVQPKDQLQTTVNLTWNLYNGHKDEASRRGAIERIGIQDTDINAMKLDLRHQLNEAFESYWTTKSQLDVSAKRLESATENYRITSDQYEYGKIDTLNLLTARSDLTTAKNDYNNANYDLFLAFSTIKRICGDEL